MKIARFVLLLSAAVSLIACEEEKKSGTPSLEVPSEYSIPYQGGDFQVSYEVLNPVEGGIVDASCQAGWVSGVTASNDIISFVASANESDADRIADLAVVYTYDNGSSTQNISRTVRLVQAAYGKDIPSGESPMINVLSGNIEATADGGSFTIEYEIVNPAEDGTVSAEASDSWIEVTDYTAAGTVSVSVAANSGAARNGNVTIVYEYADGKTSVEVGVSQKGASTSGGDGSFTIEVTDITTIGATIHVTPSDNNMTYIALVDEASEMDGMSDTQIFGSALEYFEVMAARYSTDLQSYIQNYRLMTGYQENTVTTLNPGTDYYAYALGLDNSVTPPVMTTAVTKVPFTTDTPTGIEGRIAIQVEWISETRFNASAMPDKDDFYAFDFINESILNNYGYTSGSIEDRITDFYYDNYLSLYIGIFGLENCTKRGPASLPLSVSYNPDNDPYYVYAYYVDSTGMPTSEVWITTIEDGEIVSSAVSMKDSWHMADFGKGMYVLER